MCLVLGLLNEPEHNRVQMDEALKEDILSLTTIFEMAGCQRESFGSANSELWIDFLPWHSFN